MILADREMEREEEKEREIKSNLIMCEFEGFKLKQFRLCPSKFSNKLVIQAPLPGGKVSQSNRLLEYFPPDMLENVCRELKKIERKNGKTKA